MRSSVFEWPFPDDFWASFHVPRPPTCLLRESPPGPLLSYESHYLFVYFGLVSFGLFTEELSEVPYTF